MVVIAPGFVAASVSSSALEQEAKALMESGWWSDYSFNYTSFSYCEELTSIKCNDGRSVIGIIMYGVDLGDKVKKFNFSSFPNLVSLGLKNTGLRGSIPQEIGTLSKLTFLSLSQNNLTGELSPSITNLTQLEVFKISNNSISGPIPDELGKLKNLYFLDLSYNNLTGSIPSILGLLSHNSLTGSIPSELFGDLPRLSHIDLSYNYLTGNIPLSLSNINDLNLSNNSLEGRIPDDFKKFGLATFIGNKNLCCDIK
ncbi:probable leucine-rich repeat receptor-like protein kinase At1g35710, partial [Fagus crenata]